MITYQIQYKEDMSLYEVKDKSGKLVPDVVGTAPWGTWKVIAEMPSLKSALSAAKNLVKKYGYERIQICRSTKMNVKIELES